MPKVLIIGYVWPEPQSSAAGSRMVQLMNFFKSEGFEVVFGTTARESKNMVDLNSMGITSQKLQLNDPKFDKFIERLKPDMVLFDRFMMEEQFGWRVDEICPNAVKILDTEDLHFLRDARNKAYKYNKVEDEFYYDSELTKREIAAIYRCDLSLIISEIEIDILASNFQLPNKILHYLPFLLKKVSASQQESLPVFEERQDFISIGNFLHEPNWNAVVYLREKIWPLIRESLSEAKMNIYGAYPSQKAFQLHNEKIGFLVNGWAEDASAKMKTSRVCLAPLQFGAGLKGKLVAAMQNGTPSITTTMGAEGINGDLLWSGYIENSPKQFAQKAIDIYSNKKLWQEKQKHGFEIINQRFNKEFYEDTLRKKLNTIQENLAEHRHNNFTGSMLKHHFHKSTYYLSRFIEEKNRNK